MERKKIKLGKKLVVCLIALSLFAIGTTAYLITIYSDYEVTAIGNIDLDGEILPLKWDGSNLAIQSTISSMDIAQIGSGDNVEFAHTIQAMEGSWDVMFDTASIESNEATEPWVGFDFTIEDDSENEIWFLMLDDNSERTIYFDYDLDSTFAQTEDDFPFSLVIDIIEPTDPPLAVDEIDVLLPSASGTFDVLSNDVDNSGRGLTITAVTITLDPAVAPDATICDIVGNQLSVTMSPASGTVKIEYTISDGIRTDVGELQIKNSI